MSLGDPHTLHFGCLIDEGWIEFYKDDQKLLINAPKCDSATEKAWVETNASIADLYLWRLERHLAKQAKDYLVIRGKSLDAFLAREQNVPLLADFALGIHVDTKYPVKVWVDADIDKVAKHYDGKRKGELANLLGTKKVDISRWARKMSVFERDWNLALCAAWGGFVGYPGYEWPRTVKQFEEHCAYHATSIVIGTKGQLSRYESFAKKFPEYGKEIYALLDLFR